jgi:hypothetical protein
MPDSDIADNDLDHPPPAVWSGGFIGRRRRCCRALAEVKLKVREFFGEVV